jgi:hypothetical protein
LLFSYRIIKKYTTAAGDLEIAAVQIMEPTTGIEPVNLFLTKEALYRLSYVGMRIDDININK